MFKARFPIRSDIVGSHIIQTIEAARTEVPLCGSFAVKVASALVDLQ
jgi:hypothetical protein